ncbi:MAG: WD40 repeat domain-containing protein [Nannocystaceae bacterium]
MPGDDPAVRRGHEGLIERLRWRGDGGALVSAAMDGTARVWPREGGAPVVLRRHAEGSTVVAELRGDGRLIATASTDGSARVWRLGAGDPAPIAALGPPSGRPGRGPPAALVDVAWSPGGARVAVAGEDGALRLWPVGDEGPSGPLTSLSLGTGPISHVRWIDDERLLVADGEAQLLRVEAPAGGEPVASRLAVHGAEIRDLAVAPGGRRAASVGVDGRALVLDLVGEAPPRALEHGGATLWALDFDAAGARLVTAVDDGSAWIWELDAAGSEPVVLRGHREGVLAVDFAPSGDAVVTGGADGEARLWRKRQVSEDMSEWTSVRLPHAGTGWPGDRERSVWTVAFSPDGAQVATGAADGALRIFPVEADALIAEACERVGRDLRDDERARVELGPTAPRCRRP